LSLRARVQVSGAAVIGVLVGAGLVLALEARAHRGTAEEPPASNQPNEPEVSAPPASRLDDRRLAALEAEMRELKQAKVHDSELAPAALPAPSPQSTLEQRNESVMAFHRKMEGEIASHRSEPRDERWATAKERTFSSQLAGVAAKITPSFSVVGVDCRTYTCVAELRWPNQEEAHASLRELLSSSVEIGCARRISLPDQPPAGDGYRASMLIDCSNSN
jgi:hypothetical protein